MKKLLLVSCLLFAAGSLLAQDDKLGARDYNFTTFYERKRVVPEELSLASKAPHHPEFGVLPWDAPSTSIYELPEARTAYTRMYYELGKGGKEFIKQTGYSPINYQDQAGNWIAYDEHLYPTGKAGFFAADRQVSPVTVNAAEQYATIDNDHQTVQLNHLHLYLLLPDGTKQSLGEPDLSNYTAGADGVKYTNWYPGVDLELIVRRGSVKTNIVINQAIPALSAGYLMVEDDWQMPEGYHFVFPNIDARGFTQDDGMVVNGNNEMQYTITDGVLFEDRNHRPQGLQPLTYSIKGNALRMLVPVSWLNDSARIYPVVIDPIVTSTNTLSQGLITGSGYNAACNVAGGCVYNLTVNSPANATITNIQFSFSYQATGACWLVDGWYWFDYGACQSPSTAGYAWNCFYYGPGVCNGNNVSIWSDFGPCVPAPQCASYPMNFSMHFMRCFSSGGGCSGACIGAASGWTMLITGHTIEGAAAVASPTSVCAGNPATLSGSAQGGVPPYSYSWSPGGLSGQSVTVTPASTTTYTLTVTDACGNTSTSNVTVTVSGGPTSTFTAVPNPVCAGSPVTITYTGTGNGAASYTWNFGGATVLSGSGQGPYQISWPSSGNYNVNLQVSQGGCTSTLNTVSVVVNAGPTSTFTVNPNPVCAGSTATITYTGTGTVGATYTWNFGGGTIISGSGQGPYQVSWPSSGSYNVTLQVNQSGCISNLSTVNVTVNPLPVVSLTPLPATLCVNAAAIVLNGSPAGGTYSGTGVAGNTFSPGLAGVGGPYTITYTYINGNGCTAFASTSITVVPLPVVSITPIPVSICLNGLPVVLSGNPAGGTFSGVGVAANTFDPVSAGVGGPYLITYTYTDANGCTNSTTTSITVLPVANVTINPIPSTICVNAGILSISGNPAGGIFSGPGVSGYTFDPTLAGVGGPYTISFSYTNASGCTGSASTTITVLAAPVVTINPVSLSVCVNAALVNLSGNPAGGTFSGTGVTGSTFNPLLAGVGGPYTITYTYTAGNGCSASAATSITVNPLPVVSITSPSNNAGFCINNGLVSLVGSPVGGTFSGTGVSGNTFDPQLAGVGGPYTITYSYTNANGCAATATVQLNVLAVPVVTITAPSANSSYCINNGPVNLTGSPVGGTFSGPGVAGNIFDPLVAGAGGPYTITYAYTGGNGCQATATIQITVHALPVVSITSPANNSSYCVNNAPVALLGSPAGGTFSGTGVSGNTFNPATAGVGGPYVITYTYTDANGCTGTATINLTVNALPVVSITAPANNSAFCVNGAVVNLMGTPAGGTFSGTGVSGNTFNPATAGVGGPYTITYTYTNGSGCSASSSIQVTVNPTSPVTINPVPANVCINAGPVSLTGNPSGGTFSGTGVSGNTFNPVTAGVGGPYSITYTYTNVAGCTSTATVSVTVNALPVVSITSPANNSGYCINNGAVALTGNPAGGTFSGTGVSGNSFDPSIAGVGGPYLITYSYTNGNGCSNTATVQLTVNALPLVTFNPLNNDYCANAGLVSLSGTPAGGVFSGTGVAGNNFDPSSAGAGGPYTLTYTYTNGNGCSSSDTQQVSVLSATPVSINPVNAGYCIDAGPVTLSGNPAGGVFSGPGVNGNLFDPSLAGAGGPYTITYTFTNANGCTTTATVAITVYALPLVHVVSPSNGAVFCANAGVIALQGTPAGGSFSGTGVSAGGFDPALAGIGGPYTILYQYTDANGCSAADSISVHVSALPVVTMNPLNPIYCTNSSPVSLSGTPAGGIFSGPGVGGSLFNPALAGSGGPYQLIYTYTDPNGCTGADTISVTVNPALAVSINPPAAAYCLGDSLLLTALPGGDTYHWFPGTGLRDSVTQSVVTVSQQSILYHVTVTDANQCSSTDSIQIFVNPLPVASFGADDPVGCEPFPVQFLNHSQGATQYLWSFGDGASDTALNPLHTYFAGTYDVYLHVTSAAGCTDDTLMHDFITVSSYPVADFAVNPDTGVTTYISKADYTFSNSSSGATHYQWSFGDGQTDPSTNPSHQYTDTGNYVVTLVAINDYGCADTFSLAPLVVVPDGELFIPNAFTPNGNSTNDVFLVYGTGFASFRLAVFDRWGNKVFESTDQERGWDGTFDGKPAAVGVYMYICEIKEWNGKNLFRKGDVTLIR